MGGVCCAARCAPRRFAIHSSPAVAVAVDDVEDVEDVEDATGTV